MKTLVQHIDEALKVNSKSKISDDKKLKELVAGYIEELREVLRREHNDVFSYLFFEPTMTFISQSRIVNRFKDKHIIRIKVKLQNKTDIKADLPLVGHSYIKTSDGNLLIDVYEEDGELKF